MNILDFPTRRVLPRRQATVQAVILHTTGDTDLDRILRFYSDPEGFQPHYLIEVTGTVRRIVDEVFVAYHAAHEPAEVAAYAAGFTSWTAQRWVEKTKSCVPYEGGFYPGYRTWATQWRKMGLASPLDLATGRRANACSVGIELQQPTDDLVTPDIFTEEQYTALSELLPDVLGRNKLPMERRRVLGHYDVCPLRRSNLRGGWDPGEATNWTRILKAA